jgi:hypothetical protein
VKLRKSDLKDKEKYNKIQQIVKFSFQETLKLQVYLDMLIDNKKVEDLMKMADFRANFMKLVEG